MAVYQTQQKKNLIDFLKKHPDRAFTIDAIAEEMKSDPGYDSTPGKSTIYRLMPGLIAENLVQCYAGGRGRKSSYQILDGKCCEHHMHMKCTACGRLFHMSDSDSDALTVQIRALSQFDIDLSKTLLFGRCRSCRND